MTKLLLLVEALIGGERSGVDERVAARGSPVAIVGSSELTRPPPMRSRSSEADGRTLTPKALLAALAMMCSLSEL